MNEQAYPAIEKALDEFSRRPGVTELIANNLKASIYSTPELAARMEDGLSRTPPLIKGFGAMESSSASGAAFRPGTGMIEFPLRMLSFNSDSKTSVGNAIFSVSHELEHAFREPAVERRRGEMAESIAALSRNPDGAHDYTHLIANMIDSSKLEESRATLVGWNAVRGYLAQAGKINHHDSALNYDEMRQYLGSRAEDFINGYGPQTVMKPGFQVGRDLTLDLGEGNLRAVASYYTDQRNKIGMGKTTYPNYDAAHVINDIIQQEQQRPGGPAHILINFSELGISREEVEKAGIDLRRNGGQATSITIYDTSTGTPVPGHLHHTIDTHQSLPNVPDNAPEPRLQPGASRSGFADPTHPQHALYAELRDLLPSGTSEDRLAQITAAAHVGFVKAGGIATLQVTDSAVLINGTMPGDRANVNLDAPVPSQQSSLQAAETFDQTQNRQLAQMQQQEQANRQHVGLKITQ